MGKFLLISLCVVLLASSVMAEPQIIQMGEYCPRFKTGEVLANHFTESFGICTPDDSVNYAEFLIRMNIAGLTIETYHLEWVEGIDTLFSNLSLELREFAPESTMVIGVSFYDQTAPLAWLLPSPDTIPLFTVTIEAAGTEDNQIGTVTFDSTETWMGFTSPWWFMPGWKLGVYHGLGEEELLFSVNPDTLIYMINSNSGMVTYCFPCEAFQIRYQAGSYLQNPSYTYKAFFMDGPYEIDNLTGIGTYWPQADAAGHYRALFPHIEATFCDHSYWLGNRIIYDTAFYYVLPDTCACGIPPEFVNSQPNRFVAEDVDTLAIPLQLEDYSNMPSWFSHWTSAQDPVVPGHMDSTGTFYFHPGPGDTATYWVYATLGCGTQYRDTIGFYIYNWHNYTCGDVNHSYDIDISDLTWLTSYLFQNGIQPAPMKAGDLTCDDNVDVSDLTRLVNYLFLEGPPPPENCEQ